VTGQAALLRFYEISEDDAMQIVERIRRDVSERQL
jgi:hypothetical protein